MLPNDPAADPEVERVARILCEDAGYDPDALGPEGERHWRTFVEMAVSAIAAHRMLTMR